jgi:glycosyltransferase involved in cell wall biosynthesis
LGATKGLDAAIPAIAALGDPLIHLCLVGGPRHRAEALHSRWLEAGLSADAFHWLGDLRPSEAVSMLPAFDVSLLTLPPTTHFSYYASPLKLFEYMAAGRAIVATSLPSIAEVLVSGESALLVAPDDRAALANAIAMLRDRPDLRARVGTAARLASREFTWDLRARRIIDALGPAG